jgi:hypothetical protein
MVPDKSPALLSVIFKYSIKKRTMTILKSWGHRFRVLNLLYLILILRLADNKSEILKEYT